LRVRLSALHPPLIGVMRNADTVCGKKERGEQERQKELIGGLSEHRRNECKACRPRNRAGGVSLRRRLD
jgi:hypothetical protein